MMTTTGVSLGTGDALLTINQAAALMAVSRRTIYNWIRGDKVRSLRTPGGMIRIVASSLWKDGSASAGVDGTVPLLAA